jgi:hypothetical protein
MELQVHLHQIAYSDASLQAVEPGYAVLDNCSNLRPDWYEYWPIRQHLLQALSQGPWDESAYHGFFSPKFGAKTGMSHADVTGFVRQHAADADVLLFSPQPDMGAFYLNVFEQGETFDAGLMAAFEAFLAAIGQPRSLAGLVMDSRQTVFSNYFVASGAFWRAWFKLTEQFFAICEGPDSALRQALTVSTSYPGQAQRKVFLLERIASLMLATQPRWRTRAADPFAFAWSMTRMRDYPTEAVISDALKMAYREQGYGEYLRAFSAIRQRCFVNNAPTLAQA